jgi:SAM-dependent methyltransferase
MPDVGGPGLASPGPIEFLSAPRGSEFPDEWYGLSTSDHFWFRWRLAATLRLLRDLSIPLSAPLDCLEVGSGAGTLRDQVEAHTAWKVDIADLNAEALRRARPGRGRVLYYDVLEEKLPATYDAVLVFDVIEHLDEVKPFLAASVRHLKPGGHLLINVPALSWLYSVYDVTVGHRRRYNRQSLARELDGLGLDLREVRYWGLTLVPLLLLRKAALKLRKLGPSEVIRAGFQPPGRLANEALSWLGQAETSLLGGHPPLGSSVMLLARRPER